MAKRKTKAKRSLGALPKGLPQKKGSMDVNPFEANSRTRRSKHEVHNRATSSQNNRQSALAKSLERRQTALKESLATSKKANTFVDRRIGEYTMTAEEKMLARLVRERSRRSKRVSKYSLDDDDDNEAPLLTHKGRTIDDLTTNDHVVLSDDEEEGDLDAVDTQLHFGGGSFGKSNTYGPGSDKTDMAEVYSQRKMELDDLIARRKMLKAERVKSKEEQAEVFENMDESFKELSKMLQFRDKEKERIQRVEAKKSGLVTEDDKEMDEWDKEMKEYLFERKVKATDRTKTPEEKAKEEADRLHELETRRLARMNNDFEDDDFSDVSDNDRRGKRGKKHPKKKQKTNSSRNPDELDDSEEENETEPQARFTADGLVYLDKDGKVIGKAGDDEQDDEEEENSEEDDQSESDQESTEESESEGSEEDEVGKVDTFVSSVLLSVGTRVRGNYRVKEQHGEEPSWYDGVITQVNKQGNGKVTYDVTYDDGDFEEDMEPKNVRPIDKTEEEKAKEDVNKEGEINLKRKRQKAREKARQEIPFVFEVPTTLEALHTMIGNHASTGTDASLIIQRIHASNSVRLNKRNIEKMQNFYDVLLRRFVAVGDAIYSSGDGGPELGRFSQLDALTKTLYAMSQDSPECAGAVWGRRLGIFQNAHAKRLRDAEFIDDEEEEEQSAWPSTGTILLLKALGHIFPVTDLRHHVVTPALLLLGQMVAQTPVKSVNDLVAGIMCAGLMIEFTKKSKRIAPEALAFLAGVLHLFATDKATGACPVPSLEAASQSSTLTMLRSLVSDSSHNNGNPPRLSLEKDAIEAEDTPAAILCSTLHLIRASATHLKGSLNTAEAEAFGEITDGLLSLNPRSKESPLPGYMTNLIAETALAVADTCKLQDARKPLLRRSGPNISEMAIRSLAPRMEDPSRYSMSKDKGKTSVQAAMDRTRREFKREHKAVARELRLDSAFIENERRKEKDKKDTKAREKRQKNFIWLEGEQAAMNQQVRMGGGLLSGGGMGAARAKAKSAKLGIKKGGKF